jgi:hypothetical protein
MKQLLTAANSPFVRFAKLVQAPFFVFGTGKMKESQKHTTLVRLNGVSVDEGLVHDGQEQL